MLRIAIQPPAQARPGVALYPPVAARLSSESNIYEDLAQKWAVATLIHHTGEILHDQLGGRLTDSAHPLPDTGHSSRATSEPRIDRAYFFFPDLTIYEPGRYRIRISLMQMEYSGDSSQQGQAVVCETVETHSIVVEDGSPSRGHLRSRERTFLRILNDDGQDVPPCDSG